MRQRVYVASKTANFAAVRYLHARLRHAGYTITEDWTVHITDNHQESEVDKVFACDAALADERGVRTADVVVALGYAGMCGTLVECGMAIAYKVPLIMSGPFPPSVFWYHPLVEKVEYDRLMKRIKDRQL